MSARRLRALAAFAASAALALAAPSAAHAQPASGFLNTGVGVAVDPRWSLTATRVADGTVVYSGAARTIDGVPADWADDQAGVARWIGASSSGDLAAAGATSDNARRFRYVFGASFDLTGLRVDAATSALTFRFGADNYFDPVARGLGYRLNGGAWQDPVTLAACEGKFGFDRAGDGCFTAANGFVGQMSGAIVVSGDMLRANAMNTFEFAIEGDGVTDGLYITQSRVSGLSTTVPEPSTLALLGGGLGVLGLAARRRRR
ncbi:MAG: PEP-CTERM sorting domain-containing protein [Gemmatirosa sp.]